MAEIVGMAASAVGGGVFGLIGTALGRFAGFFERRQSMAHETARWAYEVELIGLQRAAAREETEAELALADVSGSWDGLRASMAAEAAIAGSTRYAG